ncbi:hypothetical protein [Pseudomonas sp. TTU2014-080ASC]|uniref:hypothetical protein n=1 Tax=Pseudomonas sp. TTU2014-080ASC TaxID=1729724 RepID=UPI0009E9DC23|nr:hypothetical protein [Pseudomonas sp. TTU2014-080ASC]
MVMQIIDTTTDNGTYRGDPAKTAFEKCNANFSETTIKLDAVDDSIEDIYRKLPKIPDWAAYDGAANAIVLASDIPRAAYRTGDRIRFRATVTNTGATTVNVDGLGVKSVVTITGAVFPPGYIRTDVETEMTYDGVKWIADRATERVSNASGWYIRYASGKCECGNSEIINRTVSAAVYGPIGCSLPIAMANQSYLIQVENSYFGTSPNAYFFDYGIYTSKSATGFNIAFYGRTPGLPTVPPSIGNLYFTWRAEGFWY